MNISINFVQPHAQIQTVRLRLSNVDGSPCRVAAVTAQATSWKHGDVKGLVIHLVSFTVGGRGRGINTRRRMTGGTTRRVAHLSPRTGVKSPTVASDAQTTLPLKVTVAMIA